MAFWGVEVKPGKPIVHSSKKRIRITQATLGFGNATGKCLLQCNIGSGRPVLLCALLPNTTESCNMNLEFAEHEDVIFSIIGHRSVHLLGHYVYHYHKDEPSNVNSDDLSRGIDIENTASEKSSQNDEDDKYEDSFINDDSESPEPSPRPCHRGHKKFIDKKQRRRRLKKKDQVIEPNNDLEVHESEDEDGTLLSVFSKNKPMKAMGKEEGNISNKSEDDTLDGDLKEKYHEQERKKDEREVTLQKIEPLDSEVAKKDVGLGIETLKDRSLEKTMEKDLSVGATNHDEQMVEISFNQSDINEMPFEVRTFSNGLVVEVLAKGDPNGRVALPGNKVKVYFTGMLKENGCIIDSNVGKSPCKYILGREDVIDGLNMGIDGTRVGEKRRITIPPSLGFGEEGYKEKIPPDSWLVYHVELVG